MNELEKRLNTEWLNKVTFKANDYDCYLNLIKTCGYKVYRNSKGQHKVHLNNSRVFDMFSMFN